MYQIAFALFFVKYDTCSKLKQKSTQHHLTIFAIFGIIYQQSAIALEISWRDGRAA